MELLKRAIRLLSNMTEIVLWLVRGGLGFWFLNLGIQSGIWYFIPLGGLFFMPFCIVAFWTVYQFLYPTDEHAEITEVFE